MCVPSLLNLVLWRGPYADCHTETAIHCQLSQKTSMVHTSSNGLVLCVCIRSLSPTVLSANNLKPFSGGKLLYKNACIY